MWVRHARLALGHSQYATGISLRMNSGHGSDSVVSGRTLKNIQAVRVFGSCRSPFDHTWPRHSRDRPSKGPGGHPPSTALSSLSHNDTSDDGKGQSAPSPRRSNGSACRPDEAPSSRRDLIRRAMITITYHALVGSRSCEQSQQTLANAKADIATITQRIPSDLA